MQRIYERMFSGQIYRYVDYPKIIRDSEGFELGTAQDAGEEEDLRARGRKSLDPVDLERDEIAQVEGAFFVNGVAATAQQVAYIQAARAGARAAGNLKAAQPAPELATAPTQHPDGTTIKKNRGGRPRKVKPEGETA